MEDGGLDDRIRRAIADKRLVRVTYRGRARVAEPHDYGRQNGRERLLVFQRRSLDNKEPSAHGWRLLEASKIADLTVLEDGFHGSRGRNHQQHLKWDELFARVE